MEFHTWNAWSVVWYEEAHCLHVWDTRTPLDQLLTFTIITAFLIFVLLAFSHYSFGDQTAPTAISKNIGTLIEAGVVKNLCDLLLSHNENLKNFKVYYFLNNGLTNPDNFSYFGTKSSWKIFAYIFKINQIV